MLRMVLSVAILLSGLHVSAQDIASYSSVKIAERISNPDTLYIVNFWATWCGPCVKELPEFDKLNNALQSKPVKIILVSLDFKEDFPKKVQKFINKKKLAHEVIWLNETNANTFIPNIEPQWQGSIPATLIVYKQNEYRSFYEGIIKAEQILPLIEKQLALKN